MRLFKKKVSLTWEDNFPVSRQRWTQLNGFIIIPVATWIASVLNTAFGTYLTVQAVASVVKMVLTVALTVGTSLWSASRAKQPSAKTLGNGGMAVNTRTPSEPVKIIYGKAKVGLNWIYCESRGAENSDLHIVATIGEGEINGVAKGWDQNLEFASGSPSSRPGRNDMLVQGTYSGVGNIYEVKISNGKKIEFAAQSAGGTWTDESSEAMNDTANDMDLFSDSVLLEDYYVFGRYEGMDWLTGLPANFPDRLLINVGTAGVGTYSITWEFWAKYLGNLYLPNEGDPFYGEVYGWKALLDVSDGTNGFKNSGLNTVSFALPSASAWQVSHNYALGDFCIPTGGGNGFYYEVTADAGSSDGTEPTWPTTLGETVIDGGITWTCKSDISRPAFADVYPGDYGFVNANGPKFGQCVLIRARVSVLTSMTTKPKGTQAWLATGADESFIWRDNPSSSFSSPVTMTGGWQSLNNGMEIKFPNINGHGVNDIFKFHTGELIWLGERLQYFFEKWNPGGYGLWLYDLVEWTQYKGTTAQTVNTALQAYFPQWDYALKYTAYGYWIFKSVQQWIHKQLPPMEAWSGVPEIAMIIEGMLLYDTRTSTTAYSRNPALVWHNVMTSDRYGFGISSAYIDTQSVNDAANWCDSNNFYFDGVISQREDILDIVENILACFRAIMLWSEGKYKIKIMSDDAAVMALTEDDVEIGEGSFTIVSPGVPESPNKVKCFFFDAEKRWTENFVIWEDQASPGNPADEICNEIPLVGITNFDLAKKLSKYYFLRSKYNKEFSLLCHPRCYALEPGDMVTVTHEFPNWSAKKVRVKTVGLPQEGLVPITFMDENSEIYDQTIDVATRDPIQYAIEASKLSTPTGLYAVTGEDQNTVNKEDAYVEIRWNHMAVGIDYYVGFRESGVTWQDTRLVKGTDDISEQQTLRIGGLKIGTTYDYWVQAFIPNTYARSDATGVRSILSYQPYGISMTSINLTALSEGRAILLIWSIGISVANLDRWRIYRNTSSDSATAILLDEKSGPTRSYRDLSVVVGQTYYYWLKAIDRNGLLSSSFSAVAGITHRHTEAPFSFDSIDSGDFQNIDGTIGYVGTIQELQVCDSLTGLATDSSPDSVEKYLDSTDIMQGTNSLRLIFRKYPKKISWINTRGSTFYLGIDVYNGPPGYNQDIYYVHQKFKTVLAFDLKAVGLGIIKNGSPGDFELRIYSDNSGSPGSLLSSTTISASSIPTSSGENYKVNDLTYLVLGSPLTLSADTNYWLVLYMSPVSPTNYYSIDVWSGYPTDYGYGDPDQTLRAFSSGSLGYDRFPLSSVYYDLIFALCEDGDMLNKYVYYTIGSIDISAKTYIKQWLKCSRSGSGFLSSSFGEAAIGEQLSALTINEANVWTWMAWNISGIGGSSRNSVTKIGFKITDMSNDFELKVDYIIANAGEPHPAMYFASIAALKYFLMENLGKSGGQILIGGTDSGDDLTLKSTEHATKGKIFLGANSVYDEVNDKLGIGISSPDGQLSQGLANGQQISYKSLTELTTINASAYTDTAIQIPANVIVKAVQVRVTVAIPTAATFTVIGAGDATAFNTAAVSTALNTTNKGNGNCPMNNLAAQTIRITPNATPADNTGRVRVTIWYEDSIPPTS